MSARAILVATPSDRVVEELNGLRGVAVLLVVLHHLWPKHGPLAAFTLFSQLGWIGVDLFFVISGTLITGILIDSREHPGYFKNFYARRALRIFPLYYLFLALVFVLPLLREGLGGPFVAHSGSPAWYLAYLGNIPEAFFGKDPPYFLAVLWSLAIEEQFYISFPFVVAALDRKKLVVTLVALVVGAPLLRLGLYLAWPTYERVQYLFTFCRADVIALGGLLAVAVRDPRFQPRPSWVGGALVASLAALAVAFELGGLDRTTGFGRVGGYSLVALTFALLVLWTLIHRGATPTGVLRLAPLCYLGQICYGLYLLHRPADTLVDKSLSHFGVDLSPTLQLPLKVGLAVVIATLSWYAFEKPILRLKRAFARGGAEGRAKAATRHAVRA